MLVKKDFVNKKIILHGTKEECANCLAKVKKHVGDKMVVEDMADACFMNSRIYILSLDTRIAWLNGEPDTWRHVSPVRRGVFGNLLQ